MLWATPSINLLSRYIAVGADDSTVRVLDYNQATTFRIGKYINNKSDVI